MCYSVESSLKTTCLSLFAIVYLLSSQIPHFKWIGVGLIGWCGMQFAELLLWLTNPRKECTLWNKIITMTLVPIFLILQPLGFLLGSLFVIPWDKSSDMRKKFLILFPLCIILIVSYKFWYKPVKTCTTVTENGHLFWLLTKNSYGWIITKYIDTIVYFVYFFLIVLPLLMFWNKKYTIVALITITPLFAFIYGLRTDSRGSIWCYYTSFTSIISIAILFAHQFLNINLL
jgi:hypothetical protein